MKVALYLRVANAEQGAGGVLARQEYGLREWAKEQGHEVVDVFRDIAPGNSLDRPGLRYLLSEIVQNRFEAVAVHGFSRLVREPILALSLSETFQHSGVKVFSSREPGEIFSGYTMVYDALNRGYCQCQRSKVIWDK